MNTKTYTKTTASCFLRVIICALLFSASSSTQATAQAAPNIVPSLKGTVKQLLASKTPVYLPSYLPTWDYKQYGSTELGEFEYGQGYEATVATEPGTPTSSCTLFYVAAGKGPAVAPKGATQIDLGAGKVGYYLGSGNFHTLDWNIGKFAYHIACSQPQTELVKIANSMVALK